MKLLMCVIRVENKLCSSKDPFYILLSSKEKSSGYSSVISKENGEANKSP